MILTKRILFLGICGLLTLVPFAGPLGEWASRRVPVLTAASAAKGSPCAVEFLNAQTRIEQIFADQRPDGGIDFRESDSLFHYHPLLATFALNTYLHSFDRAFLERAHTVLKEYFNYLLVHHDTNDNFLIERTSSRRLAAFPDGLEDVGFNAMFALDMLSFSYICTELDFPLDALFWYQGMKTVSRELIAKTYDPAAGFFLPAHRGGATKESLYYALSVLPTYFTRSLGDNISTSVLRNYMLIEQPLLPEVPHHYLTWDFSTAERLETDEAGRVLRTLLLLGALEWNGLIGEAGDSAARARSNLETDRRAGRLASGPDVLTELFVCILEHDGPYSPFPRYHDLEIIDNLVFKKALLEAKEVAALRRSVAAVKAYLLSQNPTAQSVTAAAVDDGVDTVTQSIRQVFWSISLLREKWRDRTLFPPGGNSQIPGFDVYGAVSDLWDDVIGTLREAENLVVQERSRPSGFTITATLQKETAGPGEPVPVRFAISALANPVSVRSVVLSRNQAIDTLLISDPPLEIRPGAPPHEFSDLYPIPHQHQSTILSFTFTTEIRFDDGQRFRYHFRRGTYITKPVSFTVRFPRGTTLSGGSVPVELHVKKHLSAPSIIHAEWFSPAGLIPIEGRSLETRMPEHTNELTATMNILVPTPCRPGSFPFILKIFANGEDMGTVSSRFFKHYQWLFVGPFAERLELLDAHYPPDSRINLFDTYNGARQRVYWRSLPVSSYGDDGQIVLDTLLPDGSVGFLYTVIESATARKTTVLFESNSPAILYINGDPLVRVDPSESSSTERITVSLKNGMNNVLIKTLSEDDPVVFLQLGDEEDLTSDEFNNNLWELVDGYEEIQNIGRKQADDGEHKQRRVTLTYRGPDANSVSVVGSFNGWSPAHSRMHKNKYDEWEINLFLPPGRYAYRFLVNNSSEVLDPACPSQEPDGYGGSNSVLYIE